MTDYPPQNSMNTAPYGDPLNSGSTAYPLNSQTPIQQPPLQVNEPNYGKSAFYKTPCNCIMGCLVVVFFIVGIGVSVLMISMGIANDETQTALFGLIPLIFAVIATIMGSCISLYVTINISATLGTIIINKKKMCFCFSKQEVLQINEVQQVIVQTDYSTTYEINGVQYNAFEVIFKLIDGREVVGCSGIIDKNNEGRKAFQILKDSLPQKIGYGGNLAY
mgnify:CR=1 FL=1